MNKGNVRYGVINIKKRERYEKTYHIPYGYELMTFNEGVAIGFARKKHNSDVIVEMIYDTERASNNKMEIFRSGDFKEGGNGKK